MKRYIRADIVDIMDEPASVRADIARTTRNQGLIQSFLEDSSWSVVPALLCNPNVTDETIDQIICNDFYARSGARDHRTTSRALRKIYESIDYNNFRDRDILEDLARNPSTPGDVLRELAICNTGFVREFVAANPSTPEDVLAGYLGSTDSRIRYGIAFNPNVTEKQLRELAKDPNKDARAAVASAKHAPLDLLMQLQEDPDRAVAYCAKCTLQELGAL